MARLAISLLGHFQVKLADRHVTQFEADSARALLTCLVMNVESPFRRDMLAGLLWPERPDAAARHNLRQALNRLRNAIGDREAIPPFLQITRQIIQFNPASDYWLDVAAFTDLLAASAELQRRRPELCRSCVRLLQKAAELYGGDFLVGFSLGNNIPFEEWLVMEREHLRRQALEAFHQLAIYHEKCGEYAQAEHYARRQIELEPWREEAHRQLIRALALSGRRSEALAQYEICQRMLAKELGVGPTVETTVLCEQIKTGRIFGAATSPHLPEHNLPQQTTLFIGRETERAQIVARLLDPAYRLLTLVGTGGVGKTRLALEAARRELGDFYHGVWFVPLAEMAYAGNPALSDSFERRNALVLSIAEKLELTFSGRRAPQAQLLDHLRDKELLLLLDSLEQLRDVGSDFILKVLQSAPHVTILVTSRRRLNLQAEHVFRVAGLPIPVTTGEPEASTYSSVRLFAERAERTPAGFVLDEDNLPHVIRICRLLEGLPLGIELAATRVGQLSLAEIASAIQQNLGFLATSMRDLPERHRSLWSVFEGSWRLLSAAEQVALAQTAIFRSGFRQAAALAVMEVSIEVLESLTEQSWLRPAVSGRYSMHGLVRQFASEKLQELERNAATVGEAARERHSVFYLDFMAQQEAALNGSASQKACAALWEEEQNVRLAWRWAMNHARIEALSRSVGGFSRFFQLVGLFQEGEMVFRIAAERLHALVEAVEKPERDAQIALEKLLVEQAQFLNAQARRDQTGVVAHRETLNT